MAKGQEPEYIDPDDIWDDYSWRYPNTDLEREMLRITNRKYFKSEAQAKRVRAIERRSTGKDSKYPEGYLKEMMAWCRKMNKPRVIVTLEALISAIRNPDNLARYYQGKPVVEDRDGYTDTIYW